MWSPDGVDLGVKRRNYYELYRLVEHEGYEITLEDIAMSYRPEKKPNVCGK